MPTVAAAAAMPTPCVLVPCSCRPQPAAPPALVATMRADLASHPFAGVRGLDLQALAEVPDELPVRGAAGDVQHAVLPPERRSIRQHLPGYAAVRSALTPTLPAPSREPGRSLLLTRVPASCLAALSDILKEKWSAVYNVRTILLSIQSLLGDPNLDSPLNGHAASIWHNVPEYKKALLKHKSAHTAEPRRP